MGKATGFLEYERVESKAVPPLERINGWNEFHIMLSQKEQTKQGARCMDCGVPFCQYGEAISGMTSGCPLHNLIPEWNDMVCRGNYEQAYPRLKRTSNFPEFTCRVCPALCEKACTCGLYDEPVSTRENERAIIEYAYENGLAKAEPPKTRTKKKVAVIGSGPAGLAVADDLNRRGHLVTVYERNDRVGGLLRYGIPNMKLEKWVIDRKLEIMAQEGIEFVTNTDIGKDIKASDLLKDYDAVVVATGTPNPRNIEAPGRDAQGIYFAVDYLTDATRQLYEEKLVEDKFHVDGDKPASQKLSAKDKDVIVIGGGDTGNDCVGTAIRQGARSVTQLEMMPQPPVSRRDSNPWPQWPLVLKTDYGQEEAIAVFGADPRIYQTTVKEFKKDKKGNVKSAVLVSLESKTDEATGRRMMVPVEGSEREVKASLVLIAAGFLGSDKKLADAFGVTLDGRTNFEGIKGTHKTSGDKIFTAGDAHTGQSLVVKAIADGKACAREIDEFLMGYSNL
ncbi:MAG: glutamate synthase subunit beta [Lachnospiraceae bacterium]|nr:glutamate synthase subunit beta [Lachnospiraceae bacterium]